jgi:tocopherol O-methyltransferase
MKHENQMVPRSSSGLLVSSRSESTGNTQQDDIDVQTYYNGKTASIMRKYGPGPRVHFHIGLYEEMPLSAELRLDQLRGEMVASQERLVAHAAKIWEADQVLSGDVLDVGCGLGGGSLYWAAEHGARVTSVTIASEHIAAIRAFAAQAGVADRVDPLLSDCCDVHTGRRYDAAVAMESACYFPRDKWFCRLADLIRPGGFVCVEDTFLGSPEWKSPFDEYWHTDIGPVDEYISTARAAGFVLDRAEDVSPLTTPFWAQSVAWSEQALANVELPEEEVGRLRRSIAWHRRFLRAWEDGGIDVQLLRFRNRG